MPANQNSKKSPQRKTALGSDSVLEALRDIGSASGDSFKKDLLGSIPEDFMRQMFGFEKPPISVSGELKPGETLHMNRLLEGEKEENKKLKTQLALEKQLRQQEKALQQRKGEELKVQMHALSQEVVGLAQTTQGLATETKIAVLQAPANPGVYHIVFFERLREFIHSFRKKIESASIWMQSYNQRSARKKGFWGQVARSGAKRLLSQEDYLQRSAG